MPPPGDIIGGGAPGGGKDILGGGGLCCCCGLGLGLGLGFFLVAICCSLFLSRNLASLERPSSVSSSCCSLSRSQERAPLLASRMAWFRARSCSSVFLLNIFSPSITDLVMSSASLSSSPSSPASAPSSLSLSLSDSAGGRPSFSL